MSAPSHQWGEARDLSFEDCVEGDTVELEYVITPKVYEHFLAAFDDRSPIHVDPAYARSCGFSEPVMHGAILNGFVSHFVGMHYPGRRSLLLSVDLRYSRPSFLGDRISVGATVVQIVRSQRVVVLKVVLRNLGRGQVTAVGRVQVAVRTE